jgi:hypothetical protein
VQLISRRLDVKSVHAFPSLSLGRSGRIRLHSECFSPPADQFPPARSYNASSAGTRPCQDMPAAADGNRTYFPMSTLGEKKADSGGGNLWFLAQTEVENISFNYADSADPATQDEFAKWDALTGLTPGSTCLPSPDFGEFKLAALM